MSENHDQSLGNVILHHVTNDMSHKFIELELFGYDISVTKHVIMLWIVSAVVIGMALWGTRRYRQNPGAQPKGLSHIYEILLNFLRKDIIHPNIGVGKTGDFWTPLLGTYFIFILTCNLLGMIPFFEKIPGGSATITGNFYLTAALATITFFSIIVAGSMKHGFGGYWKNMIPSGVPAPVLIILIPIEIIGMFVRPFALTMRLGANMTAGHIGLLAIFGLPIILNSAFVGLASIILNVGIYFLEFIVCLVQAYVFTLLSAVFIGMAIHAEH